MRFFRPGRLVILGLLLLAVVAALWAYPSGEYIFLPDVAHPVAPLVTVPHADPPKGGAVYYVDVIVRKASLLERLFHGLHTGADVYPADVVNPPGVNDAKRQQLDLLDMRRSQSVAAAVALRALGRKVGIVDTGALVTDVIPGEPAAGKILPEDVITAIDGARVRTTRQVFETMTRHRIGDTVRFTVRRQTRTLVLALRTVASTGPPRRPVVGIIIEQAADIHLPIPVRIDAGGVGGPSAGVAFALEVMEKLGRDVVHGHRIAATGELSVDGSVSAIGGVKQKVYGARAAHVDAFLVPAGDNAKEARKYAGGLRIIPVESFQQALAALAKLR